jgi:adenylate kinase
MKDLIVIAGAPGSGKTTVGELLHARLQSVYIDFGDLRVWHLDREWKKASQDEEAMSFENLIFVVNNYVRHEYKNVIVTDLKDEKVQQIPGVFQNLDFVIFSLFVETDEEISRRVAVRNSGFKNVNAAVAWNRALINRACVANEYKIDNTHNDPQKTLDVILQHLEGISLK